MLPIINETHLVHDIHGVTINNGSFMVYEAMKWNENRHLVSIKRLHSRVAEGGSVSLLLNELNAFRYRINNFPKILSLMGFSSCSQNAVILMFERIAVGSLFHILHEIKLARKPKIKSITSIMLNVCDALIYMHEKNLLHCYVNSHSIFLTHHHMAKLGNLEFSCDLIKQPQKFKIVENRYKNCAYNWLPPEIMTWSSSEEEMITPKADMYSFCVVIWELFNSKFMFVFYFAVKIWASQKLKIDRVDER